MNRHKVRCTLPGCGWTGRRTGRRDEVTDPCPRCGPLAAGSQSTVVIDEPNGEEP